MIPPRRMPPGYIESLETLARRWGAGTWTGTNGSLAAALFHALQDRAAILANHPGGPAMHDRPVQTGGLEPDELAAAWSGFTERHRARRAAELEPASLERPEAPAATPDRPPSERLLLEAAATVAERRKTYGPCAEHFTITIGLLNAALGPAIRARVAAGREPLELTDWPLVMILDKVARYTGGGGRSRDCAVDLAGYAGTLRECEDVAAGVS
jgi:hypothetical protein